MHPYFAEVRTASEEEQFLKEKEKSLRRVESSTNQRGGTATMSRNHENSRSRSGLRNNKMVKGTMKGMKNNDPLQDNNMSRSLGRKQTEMNAKMSGQQLPYGNQKSYNIRDSSVSNNSNCGSSLAAYTQGAGK